jgi:hypothetical protein
MEVSTASGSFFLAVRVSAFFTILPRPSKNYEWWIIIHILGLFSGVFTNLAILNCHIGAEIRKMAVNLSHTGSKLVGFCLIFTEAPSVSLLS